MPDKIVNLCNGCDLCCRMYKIYLFPSEAKKIAKYLGIDYKSFVEDYLDIYFELFSYQSDKFLSVEINNKIYSFFPIMALKQKNSACIFLKEHLCSIYPVRPLICQLFPKFKITNEKYSFCKIDDGKPMSLEERKKYYNILDYYLKELKQKGFFKVWKYLPRNYLENIYLKIDNKKIEDRKIKEDLFNLL